MKARDVTDASRSKIYEVVQGIPPGCVATYGQVAELAGMPGAARFAGAAMRNCPEGLDLPWHRVVGRRSRTIARVAIEDGMGAGVQRQLLEAEGIRFTESGGIPLREHGWLPIDA